MKLHAINNDTGDKPSCGPTVLACVTGEPLSKVLARVAKLREHFAAGGVTAGNPIGSDAMSIDEIEGVLASLFFDAQLVDEFGDGDGPTVAEYAARLDDGEIVVISLWADDDDPDDEGHVIAVGGDNRELVDTHTEGKPVPLTEAPHLEARVAYAWRVRPLAADDAAGVARFNARLGLR